MEDKRQTEAEQAPTPRDQAGDSGRVRLPRRLRKRRTLAVGDVLLGGRFRLTGVLGRGGMGVVFEAFDEQVGEAVALKSLNWLDGRSLEQLKHEFRVLAHVEHPNLVGLRGLFQDGDLSFFTMDLVRGVPFLPTPDAADTALAATRRTGPDAMGDTPRVEPSTLPMMPLQTPRAVEAAAQTAQGERTASGTVDEDGLRSTLRQLLAGVSAIHEAGKVHRDLKPSNVLVTEDGRVVILDFGLAGERPQNDEGEPSERVSGTPAYMAPEQAAGMPPQPENDCYAVGVMLYQALTGHLPFKGSPARVMADKQQHDPVPPLQRAPHTPQDLSELCMALLARDPLVRLGADQALGQLGGQERRTSSLRAPRMDAFVGRDALVRRMGALFDTSHRLGRPTLIDLSGASGLGKSALLQQFADLMRQQKVLFLEGRCYEREGLPHKGIDEVLGQLTRALHRSGALRTALAEVDVAALRTLLPDLKLPNSVVPEPPRVAAGDPRAIRQRAYNALRNLLSALSQRRPLVIAIDDMQWADSDGVRLLLDLLGGPQPPPVLWVLSRRSGPIGKDRPLATLHSGVAKLLDAIDLDYMQVEPLDETAAKTLVQRLLDEAGVKCGPSQLSSLCREGAGSPLLLSELTRHFAERGGDHFDDRGAMQDLLVQRLADLDPAARTLFDLVCVSGRPLPPRLLASASRLEGPEAWLRDLRQRRLLRQCRERGADAVDVFHDSIRERALRTLSKQDRRAIHAQLARAYESDPERNAEHLVTHWEGAGEFQQAARYARVAAQNAEAALAFDHAAALYKKALALPEGLDRAHRSELQLLLAEALSNSGRGAEAAPIFMRIADEFDHARGLELRRRAAEQWLVSGRSDEGMRALQGVLSEVGLSLPKGSRRALAQLLLTRAQLRLRGLDFTPVPEADIPRAELLRIDVCRAAWALSFMNTIQGAAFQARYLQLALKAGEPRRVAVGLGMEAIFRSTKGTAARHEVEALKRRQEAIAERMDDPLVRAFVPLVRGHSAYMVGRWLRCSQALSEAEELLATQCRDVSWELNSSRFFWGNALALQGRLREVGTRLHDWLRDAYERGDLYASASLELLSTRCVTLAMDRPEDARRDIGRAMDRWQASSFGVQDFLAEISRLQVALYEGDSAEAMACFERVWPAFTRSMMNQVQLCRIQAHQHAGAALLSSAAQSANPGPLLERALVHAARLEAEQAPWARPFASYVRAGVAHLSGDAAAAARSLGLAGDQFRAVDMGLYAAAVKRRLGVLVGGTEGRALVEAADNTFTREGVRSPERLAAMMAPGFDE